MNERPAIQEGRTAIEGAAEHGRLDMVYFLLRKGAKGDTLGKKGFDQAISLATKQGHLEIAKLLKSQQNMKGPEEGQSSRQCGSGNGKGKEKQGSHASHAGDFF